MLKLALFYMADGINTEAHSVVIPPQNRDLDTSFCHLPVIHLLLSTTSTTIISQIKLSVFNEFTIFNYKVHQLFLELTPDITNKQNSMFKNRFKIVTLLNFNYINIHLSTHSNKY